MSPARKFRIGVVLESLELPAWQLALLESLQLSDVSTVALVVLDTSSRSGPNFLYRLAHATFARFGSRADENKRDASESVSAAELLLDVPIVQVERSCKDDCRVADSIRAHNLDLLLTLGDRQDHFQWRTLAHLGVWYFDTDGMPFVPHDGSMAGLAETLWRKPFMSTTLRFVRSIDADCRIAYETHSPVDPMSHAVTRNQLLWKCSTFPSRALRACARGDCDEYMRSLPVPTLASRRQMLAHLAVVSGVTLLPALLSYAAWRIFQKTYRLVFSERWVLMSACRANDLEHTNFRRYTPPPGRFWADPHLIYSGARCFVFFEDADRNSGVGHISVAEVSDTGELLRPREVLRKPYHLSYPFVFEWNDCLFLVPESAANRTVELYRCVRFPDEWVFLHNLMEDVSVYDATLYQHQGHWWMFANVPANEGASCWDELHLFWADSPISRQWNAHPLNPVISDVRRARPAGPLFTRDGHLFRPSQDSSGRYGRALNINKVVELSTTKYRESMLRQMVPNQIPNASTVHSYSSAGCFTFIDAIIRERRHGQGVASR